MTNHSPHVSCVCLSKWVCRERKKRETVCQCVCVGDRRGWQSEGSANGRAHASAGPGLWLLISMCHSVPFPTRLAAQINPVHSEWRKPATETRVWCDTHSALRKKTPIVAHDIDWCLLMCISPSLLHFFFWDSGKPKAACVAQWGTTQGLRSRVVWLLLKE